MTLTALLLAAALAAPVPPPHQAAGSIIEIDTDDPLGRDLWAWYPFGVSYGARITLDISGNGHHGSWTGSQDPDWVMDNHRVALFVDAKADEEGFYIPFNWNPRLSGWSVSFWYRADGSFFSGGGGNVMFGSDSFVLICEATNTMDWQGGCIDTVRNTMKTDGSWNQITFVWTAGANYAYQNGLLEDSGAPDGSVCEMFDGICVGAAGPPNCENSGRGMRDYISDIRMYNRGLTADEVRRLYREEAAGLLPGAKYTAPFPFAPEAEAAPTGAVHPHYYHRRWRQ